MGKKEATFKEKLERIYDELWGMKATTPLSTYDDSQLSKIINLIDDTLGR